MNTHGATVNRGEIVSMYAGLKGMWTDNTRNAKYLTHSHSRDFVKHVQSPQEFDLDMPHIPCQHPKYPIITIAS